LPSPELRLALELLADESSDNSALCAELEASDRLRFAILIAANSAPFGGFHSTGIVSQAVAMLGRRKCAAWLWFFALSELIARYGDLPLRARRRLWKHSLLTGVIVHRLLEATKQPTGGEGFAAGMAHDVGHLLMASPALRLNVVWHEEHEALAEQSPSVAPDRDHCRLGNALLEFWHAPDEISAAALHHHEPALAPPKHASLVAAVRMADLVAEYLDVDRPAEPLHLPMSVRWRELAQIEPWNTFPQLDETIVELLPEALLSAEHLGSLLSD
jgi:HD-like signal output (HDOD) protein